jgi:transposase
VKGTPDSLAKNMRAALQHLQVSLPAHVERILCTIEGLNESIDEADKALKQIAERDPVCKLLQTMPGVGPVTAVCFATAIDDVQRFESASKVTSYLGLTPGENTTGFKTNRTGMTKAGPIRVRWTLTQAAWSMTRCRPNDPIVQWFKQVAGRRGKKVAITALSRKMAGILYAMWRDQKSYNPSKAVQEQP